MQIFLTGASGFIGQALLKVACKRGIRVRPLFRSEVSAYGVPEAVIVPELDGVVDLSQVLQGVDVVIHAAARAHIMREEALNPLAEYRRVNVQGTLNLALQAANAGVRRFVFLSSIGVNGNLTVTPFTEFDEPKPHDAYSLSKFEAEKALLELAAQTQMEVVIIRPPLVYGPNVSGNFGNLVRWVQYGLPLPLGSVHNRRSLVALENLVSFILLCANPVQSPLAANQVFLVADEQDVSTTNLLLKVAQAAGCPIRLLPVPQSILRIVATLLCKRTIADRLLGNLQVNTAKARTLLDWRPVISMDEQLAAMFIGSPKDSFASLPSYDPTINKNITYTTGTIIRFLDIALSSIGLLILWPLLVLLYGLGLFDTGAPLFRQERVGRYQKPFVLIKFRTMRLDTDDVASHLVSRSSITPFGAFLRRSKLDELPQLWNVLKGQMSLVGPRPCLFNQTELVRERTSLGVFAARPGITGLAQVNDIDMSTPKRLAEIDAQMLQNLTLAKYFKYLLMTIIGRGRGDRVK